MLGLGGLSMGGASGGAQLTLSPDTIPAGKTGALASVRASLTGSVSYLSLTGTAAALSIDAAGTVTVGAAQAEGATLTLAVRAESDTGDQVGKRLALKVGPPDLALTGASYATSVAAGSQIGTFTLGNGETIVVISPNDGRLAIGGGGTTLVRGLSAASAGSTAYAFTSSTGRTLTATVTATALPPIPAQFWTLTDSFSGLPDGPVASRSGWLFSGGGVQVEGGKLRGTAQYGSFTALLDQQVSDGFEFQIDYSLANGLAQPMDYNDPHRIILWTDSATFSVYMTLENVNGQYIRMTLSYDDASSNHYVGAAGVFDTSIVSGVITIQVSGNQLRVRQNGQWNRNAAYANAWPMGQVSLANVPAAYRTGRPGVQVFNRQPFLRGARVRPLDTIVMAPTFYPRDNRNATNATAVPIHVQYSGGVAPSYWVARVLKWSDQSVIQDWRLIDNPSFSNGIMSGTMDMPVTPYAGAYTIEAGLIGADGLLHTNRSDYCYIGRAVFGYGQSNSAQFAAASTDGFDMPGALSLYETGGAATGGGGRDELGTPFAASGPIYSWLFDHVFTDRGSANGELLSGGRPGNTALCGHLYAMDGIPTAMIRKSYSATDIAAIRSSLSLTGQKLSRAWGKVEAVVWYQGENNLSAEYGSPVRSYYAGQLAGAISDLRTALSDPDLPWFVVPLSYNQGSTGSNYATINPNFVELARAQADVIASVPKVYWAGATLGLPHGTGSDLIHLTGNASWELCRRIGYTVAKQAYGISEPDGLGPRITGAAKTGASQITLAVDLNGAGTLTASGSLTGYEASADDFVTKLAGTWAVSGTLIVFTASSPLPSGAIQVRSMMDLHYDDSVLAMGGGYADGRAAIPAFPALPVAVA